MCVCVQNCSNGWTSNDSKLPPEDQEILKQPCVEALAFMGHDRELIVYAVKILQKQQRALEVGRLMLEVENLEKVKSRGEALPSLDQVKSAQEKDQYGSDGESSDDDDSLEYVDANPPPGIGSSSDGDLQMDCSEPEIPSCVQAVSKLPEPTLKKVDGPPSGKDVTALKRKLLALRSENKRLKERQLCRDCHIRQVSITFLPCGHYSYCYDCGQRFSACPICRKTILADVRTFLA